jgi:creatinine amidohydrolase
MLTWENTWKEIADSGITVAVLPIGATEQHGTSLPLLTDSLMAAKVAEAVAGDLGAYLLPALPVGTSATHLSFPGTLTLRHETLAAVIGDLVDSLFATGFKSVVLVSLHGGNYVVWSDLPQRLEQERPGLRIAVLDTNRLWSEASHAAGMFADEFHSGECEASALASLRPDLVRPGAVDFPEPHKHLQGFPVTQTGFPQDVRQVSPMGALGEPSKGTREKGDRFWQAFLPLAIADIRRQLT